MSNAPRKLRIIAVDDEPFMLELLTQVLARLGHADVVACESGQEGLDCLAASASPVDLILLDINMPGMDGVEFVRRLVACGYTGGVVLVTGEDGRILASVEKLVKAHRLHLAGCLRKPVNADELAQVIDELPPNGGGSAPPARAPAQPVDDVRRLRAAVAGGELVNFYQPKVCLTTGDVVGVESLVRWQPPGGGLIFPDQFIGLAEQHGLVADITYCVLRAALRDARVWQLAGHELPVAVNVSMDDLTSLDFPDIAAALTREAGIEANLVTLEVTEGQVMGKLSTALDVLSRLRLRRFRLAIDDFGTGHSSLAQLRDLPFDELKIDRGFVHGAAREATLQAICTASLQLAQQLNLNVVAEGIEHAEDWLTLREMGCEVGQGYLIARPMPAKDLPAWMSGWRARSSAPVKV